MTGVPAASPAIVPNLDHLLAESYLVAGMRPSLVAQRVPALGDHVRDLAARVRQARPATIRRKSHHEWTDSEDDFLRANLGLLSDAQIGAALGRSATAVHIRWVRVLHLTAPSKRDDLLTGNKAGRALGLDIHKLSYLVDTGIIPGRVMAGNRKIRLIRRDDLVRWAVDPRNWPWFKLDRVGDPHLKRLIELRRERWGDEWWTTRQVADHHGVLVSDVKRYIEAGRLPAVQIVNYDGRISEHADPTWSYWFVRRSHAQAVEFYKRKGNTTGRRGILTQAAKDFIQLCRGVGIPHASIAVMMDVPFQRVRSQIESRRLAGRPYPFVDWREHADRFPSIVRAARDFLDGRSLDRNRRNLLRSILFTWARNHHIHIPRVSMSKLTVDHLRGMHATLIAAGVDPFAPLGQKGQGRGNGS